MGCYPFSKGPDDYYILLPGLRTFIRAGLVYSAFDYLYVTVSYLLANGQFLKIAFDILVLPFVDLVQISA